MHSFLTIFCVAIAKQCIQRSLTEIIAINISQSSATGQREHLLRDYNNVSLSIQSLTSYGKIDKKY